MIKIKESPFKDIINEEWKRYKKIYSHAKQTKPEFSWAKTLRNNWVACIHRCYNFKKHKIVHKIQYRLNLRYLEQTQENLEKFRKTTRHELAHINTSGHGKDFLRKLAILEGERYATYGQLPKIPKNIKQ